MTDDVGDEPNDNVCTNCNLANFIAKVFANDLLGRISNMHLALSDLQRDGARDNLVMKVARAQSYAVDA